MNESALYAPVKAFLERLGFAVKGEVRGCDVVAVRGNAVVVAELKLALTLDLLLQAADRLMLADEVWLAVRATRRGRDRDARAHRLCRMLGVGLLAVGARGGVEVLVQPGPYHARGNKRRRSLLVAEFRRRRGDPNEGGGNRRPVMTAYRQAALDCAAALRGGPCRPRDLRAVAADAGRILRDNVHGWFERVRPGFYRLSPEGAAALETWRAHVVPDIEQNASPASESLTAPP